MATSEQILQTKRLQEGTIQRRCYSPSVFIKRRRRIERQTVFLPLRDTMNETELRFELRKLIDFYTIYEEDDYGCLTLNQFKEDLFEDAVVSLLKTINLKL